MGHFWHTTYSKGYKNRSTVKVKSRKPYDNCDQFSSDNNLLKNLTLNIKRWAYKPLWSECVIKIN